MSETPALRSEECYREIAALQEIVFASINTLDSLLELSETEEQDKNTCMDVGLKIMHDMEDFKALVVPKFSDSSLFLALMVAQKGAHEALMDFVRDKGSLQDIREKLAIYHDAVQDFV